MSCNHLPLLLNVKDFAQLDSQPGVSAIVAKRAWSSVKVRSSRNANQDWRRQLQR
jgi:hypothetical protein